MCPDTDVGRGAPAAPSDSVIPRADAALAPEGRATVRVRVLPRGEFRDARLLDWKGALLEVDLTGSDCVPGEPLEIESGSMLYWGALQRRAGSLGAVLVEHSLDRAALASDRDQGA